MATLKRTPRYLFKHFVFLLGIFISLPILTNCSAANMTGTSTSTPVVAFSSTLSPTQTLTPSPTFTPTMTEPSVLCGGPPIMYILLVGSDTRGKDYSIGLADSIRIVRVDFVEPRVQVLTFQRDLYVEIPGIESYNVTMGKLNQAYLYGNPGYGFYTGPGQGPGLLALTLKQNFGAQVDHYAAVNLRSFEKIVDTLGGIDIKLPYTVNGRVPGSRDPDRYFASGNQHLNGYRTMLLARMRPLGDFRRSQVQNLILQALAKKMLSPITIKKMPDLIDSFYSSVQTDLGVTELGQLVCLAEKLDVQKIEFINFPEDLFKGGRIHDPVLGNTFILNADFDVMKKYVQAFNMGKQLGLEETLEDGMIIP